MDVRKKIIALRWFAVRKEDVTFFLLYCMYGFINRNVSTKILNIFVIFLSKISEIFHM
jgi:hypothetical protein